MGSFSRELPLIYASLPRMLTEGAGRTNLQDDSEDMPSASQAYLSQRNLDPAATFGASQALYVLPSHLSPDLLLTRCSQSVLSMAPSQAASTQSKRFFSTLPLATLIPILISTLTNCVPRLRSPVTAEVTEDGTAVLAAVVFRFVDSRKMNITAQLRISRGGLPKALVEEVGIGSEDVDGLDVVVWKKYGDPTQLLKVWRTVVEALPRDVIFTM